MEKRRDRGIPYGIADFRRIRTEGYYYVDKTDANIATDLVRLGEIAR